MHRIDGPGAVSGLFTVGNPGVPQMATVVTPEWLNDVQENIVKVITAAGIELEKGNSDQLRQAIALTATATAPSTGMPHVVLDYPTVCTADNRAGVTGQAGPGGGKVNLPAGLTLTLGQDLGGGRGSMGIFTSAAWQSPELLPNATYYLRGQVATEGALVLYVQQGTDADAIPANRKGTPSGAAGGGFDSTALDILMSRVVTGAAGSLPVITDLANAKALQMSVSTAAGANIATSTDQIDSYILNWARKPMQSVIAGFQRAQGEAALGVDVYCTALTRYGFSIASSYIKDPSNLSVYRQVGYKVVVNG